MHKKVEPLKKTVEQMTIKLTKLREELIETENLLNKLNSELAELEENRQKKQATLDELTKQANLMERRLNAAKKLISGLSREQVRWTDDREVLLEKRIKLIGDCLVCSSFLSYAGPFDFSFRKRMIYQHWSGDVKERGIPSSENFRVEELLTSDVEISQWASEGLPSDELSVQNGILTTRASRWPLCIDPQLQAVSWIKRREEKDNGFKLLNLNEGAQVFLKPLENCIKFGKPCLFENVDEELDPTIDPVLERNFIVKAGLKLIKLGENEFE